VKAAVRQAEIAKPASCHTLRHSSSHCSSCVDGPDL
jgi:site-specific recombinase XerD